MDAVYICRNGDNEELRYSIRSIIENMPHDNVWVVGGKPEWYSGKYLEVFQDNKKYENARKNLMAIALSPDISDDFILMNDDFFVINKIDSPPYWYTGSIKSRVEMIKKLRIPNSSYIRLLTATRNAIIDMGIEEPLDYELHIPMIMNKAKLLPLLNSEALWRSAYGNAYGVGGTIHEDIKVYGQITIEGRHGTAIDLETEPFLSGSDASFPLLLDQVLADRFPNKSIYED